jgi:DNA-directed RNA polymerase specialized sigma24 family protein
MTSVNQAEIEGQVRTALAAHDVRLAATRALESFGPDVLRFLSARLAERARAEVAYLQFGEDLWVGLPAFRWDMSLRAWMFVVARAVAIRVTRKRPREVELPPGFAGYPQLREHVRTTTARYLRTEVKDRMREIRQQLDEYDQTLLILRIDRKLDWNELAVVMNEVSSDAGPSDVADANARLQKCFQTAKQRLRSLAEAEGLLQPRTETETT